jgi:hypothetical protein
MSRPKPVGGYLALAFLCVLAVCAALRLIVEVRP